jgi:hypothetical protein
MTDYFMFYESATRLLMLFYNHLKLEKINQIFGIIIAAAEITHKIICQTKTISKSERRPSRLDPGLQVPTMS